MNSPKAHSDKFSAYRFSNRRCYGCFADAGRPDKADNLPVYFSGELCNGKILDDSVLNLLKAVMFGIKDSSCVYYIKIVFALLGIRKIEKTVDICAHRRHFMRTGREHGKSFDFFFQFCFNLGRKIP